MTNTEYQIKDREGIVFGRFSKQHHRDKALTHVDVGFAAEEVR